MLIAAVLSNRCGRQQGGLCGSISGGADRQEAVTAPVTGARADRRPMTDAAAVTCDDWRAPRPLFVAGNIG